MGAAIEQAHTAYPFKPRKGAGHLADWHIAFPSDGRQVAQFGNTGKQCYIIEFDFHRAIVHGKSFVLHKTQNQWRICGISIQLLCQYSAYQSYELHHRKANHVARTLLR